MRIRKKHQFTLGQEKLYQALQDYWNSVKL